MTKTHGPTDFVAEFLSVAGKEMRSASRQREAALEEWQRAHEGSKIP